jgi:environmental stress-induced protein Ves
MKITHLKSRTFQSTEWSGGLTTELFIYPPESAYQDKSFDFRLSTATVEIEESVFTPLANISRTLMVLEGNMQLIHKGQHKANLSKFSVDRFDGVWQTSSVGKCIDFNLMTMKETKGDQIGINVLKDQKLNQELDTGWDWVFLYLHTGAINIDLDKYSYKMNIGDLLVINKPNNPLIELLGASDSELVLVYVKSNY